MDILELKKLISEGEKVNVEFKKAESSLPKSVYESYSAFANTNGGYIVLGIKEDKSKQNKSERFVMQGICEVEKQKEDFWNTINGDKVNVNILRDEDVSIVEDKGKSFLVIHVPRAEYNLRPVYIGDNPYKGTFKRNHEGDYHSSIDEIKGFIRDQDEHDNDSTILEGYDMDDIDAETLECYRRLFRIEHVRHVWNDISDKEFLEKLGGYRRDKKEGIEGLTIAGLLMFGKGIAIRNRFSNVFMDYRNETDNTFDVRWKDRITYDGTWENNLYNFFSKVALKITEDLPKPFKLVGMRRVDETPACRAIREALVNLIIHADYQLDAVTLKVIKKDKIIELTNPGILKISMEDVYRGGISKPRNPHIQTMLRMVGYGDNAGSGFVSILSAWKKEEWIKPELIEDTRLNQVTLKLTMLKEEEIGTDIMKVPKSAEECRSSTDTLHIREKLTEQEAKIYDYLDDEGEITTIIATKVLNVKERRAREILSQMCKKKYLIKRGATNNSKYVREIKE